MTQQKFKRVILYARQHRANQGVNESLHRLVEYLADQKINYTRYDIEHSEEAAQRFIRLGGTGTPLVWINGHVVHGLNYAEIRDYLR